MGANTYTFRLHTEMQDIDDLSVEMSQLFHASRATKTLRARRTFTVRETIVALRGRVRKKALPSVEYSLSRARRRDDDEISLTAKRIGAPRFSSRVHAAARRRTVTKRLRLPKRTPRGRYWLIACLRHKRGHEDFRAGNDCRILSKPLKVGSKFGTRGAARRRFFRGD